VIYEAYCQKTDLYFLAEIHYGYKLFNKTISLALGILLRSTQFLKVLNLKTSVIIHSLNNYNIDSCQLKCLKNYD
ncbi:hypothetical protein BpHYR1_001829, partial [Brachionus plicatilis]